MSKPGIVTKKTTHRRAAEAIVWASAVTDPTRDIGVRPHADARDVCEALGLITGHTITTDDTDAYHDVTTAATYHSFNSGDGPLTAHGTVEGAEQLHADGRLCLRCQAAVDREGALIDSTQKVAPFQQLSTPPAVEKPKSKPKSKSKSKPKRKRRTGPPTTPTRRKTAACGTPAGHARHCRIRKTDPTHRACDTCKAASAAATAARAINRANPDAPPVTWQGVLAARQGTRQTTAAPAPAVENKRVEEMEQQIIAAQQQHCRGTRRDGNPCEGRGYPYCGHHRDQSPDPAAELVALTEAAGLHDEVTDYAQSHPEDVTGLTERLAAVKPNDIHQEDTLCPTDSRPIEDGINGSTTPRAKTPALPVIDAAIAALTNLRAALTADDN